jgi:threonine/homoserine efflux transporter RhtA
MQSAAPFAMDSSVAPRFRGEPESRMNMTLSIAPLISLIAGILILVVPRLLNYIVAIYLIIIGLIGLFGAGNFHFK